MCISVWAWAFISIYDTFKDHEGRYLLLVFISFIMTFFYDSLQVEDEDIGTDKELGNTTISLYDLQPDTEIEVTN